VLAVLAGEPWCALPSEARVRRLTLRQVCTILLWPRDKDGRLVFDDEAPTVPERTPEDRFVAVWVARKCPEWWARARWRAREAEKRRRGKR